MSQWYYMVSVFVGMCFHGHEFTIFQLAMKPTEWIHTCLLVSNATIKILQLKYIGGGKCP